MKACRAARRREYNREWGRRPEQRQRNHDYYQQHVARIYAYQREREKDQEYADHLRAYRHEYYRRPEVRERQNARHRERRRDEQWRERDHEHTRVYRQHPEVREQRRLEAAKRNVRLTAARRALAREAPRRLCEMCGTPYLPYRDNQRFCSQACRHRGRPLPEWQESTRSCEQCGVRFTVKRYGSRQCYCTRACWEATYRARHRAAMRENNRRYRLAHPEVRDREGVRYAIKKWAWDDSPEAKEIALAYYEARRAVRDLVTS